MNSNQVLWCFGLLLAIGLCSVDGAAIREKRQLNSLLTLSGESNARIENGKLFFSSSFKLLVPILKIQANLNAVEKQLV